jgi:CRISPR/Cas system-associated exonuclease Cas4 (RecB family)
MINIKAAVINGIEALEREKPFDLEERAKWLNASEAGTCIRKQWFSKHSESRGWWRGLEQPTEREGMGYARRGTLMEKYLVEALKAANVPLVDSGSDTKTWTDPERKLSGTPDGILMYDEERDLHKTPSLAPVPIEFKSIDPRTNKKNLPRAEHVLQLQINMHLIELNVDLPGWQEGKEVSIKRGLLIYINASDYDDITQFDVDPLTASELERLTNRAKKVLGTRKVDLLDREGKRDGGRECRSCPFRDPCGVTGSDVEYKTDRGRGNRGSALSTTANEYIALKDAESSSKKALASLGEDIKREMKSRKLTKITVDGIDIEVADVAGRRSLDRKAVTAAGVDLSQFEKTGAPSERLTVSRR